MTNRTAAIWARVSTQGQAELSLDSQVNEVKSWLEEQGWCVPDGKILRVTWTSLEILSCPDAQVLLDWVRKGEIGAIGLYHGDRLSGKPAHKAFLLEQCQKHGVEVLSKNSPLLQGREGELIDFVLTWSKETSVLRTQMGAKQGLRDRAIIKGLPSTTRGCYGYVWQGDKHGGKLVPDKDYANVCEIWQMALSGKTLTAICREFYRRGIPSPNGKATWSVSSIRVILANPVYAGRIGALKYERKVPQKRRNQTYGKSSACIKPIEEWHWLEGLVESPAVTWEEFKAVRERSKLNRLYARRNAKRYYLLRGLIKCHLCGRHYYGIQRSKRTVVYVCSASWSGVFGKKCLAKPLRCMEIEAEVKEAIRSFLEDPDIYVAEIEQRSQLEQYTVEGIGKRIAELEKQYQQTIDDERRKLELLTEEAFKQAQALIKARRTWLKEEVEREKVKLVTAQRQSVTKDRVEATRKRLENKLNGATDEDWRFILEALGTKIVAFGDGTWDIEVNIPATPIKSTTPWSSTRHRCLSEV